jgi:hypothetical protein
MDVFAGQISVVVGVFSRATRSRSARRASWASTPRARFAASAQDLFRAVASVTSGYGSEAQF